MPFPLGVRQAQNTPENLLHDSSRLCLRHGTEDVCEATVPTLLEGLHRYDKPERAIRAVNVHVIKLAGLPCGDRYLLLWDLEVLHEASLEDLNRERLFVLAVRLSLEQYDGPNVFARQLLFVTGQVLELTLLLQGRRNGLLPFRSGFELHGQLDHVLSLEFGG